jgi:hypothetical protein
VAMVGQDIKQTRCTTCDAEHEYKHAKVPRLRRPKEAAALSGGGPASKPKRVRHEPAPDAAGQGAAAPAAPGGEPEDTAASHEAMMAEAPPSSDVAEPGEAGEEGPVHRPLIRATLPRPEGLPAATRPAPDFTIRQPGGRPPHRFRPRQQRGQSFQGRPNSPVSGGGPGRGPRPVGGRVPQHGPHAPKRHGSGRKRSK